MLKPANFDVCCCCVRIAHQLRLDFPPPTELPERVRLNRLRTWYLIAVVDYSHCIQRGKTPAKARNGFADQVLDLWYRSSACNLPYDIYCAAYLDMMHLTSQFLDCIRPDKSNPDLWQVCLRVSVCSLADSTTSSTAEPDVLSFVRDYDRRISDRFSHWQKRLTEQRMVSDWPGWSCPLASY